MLTKSFLNEIDQANALPLNVEARKRLREVKAPVYKEGLYVFQLAQWGLSQGLAPEKPSRDVLESGLRNLEASEPEKALRYLFWGAEPPEDPEDEANPVLTAESLSGSPEYAAENVLMTLAQGLIEDPRMRQLYHV